MRDEMKTKALIVLLAASLIVPAFLVAYQPTQGGKALERSEELWTLMESSTVPSEKVVAFSKDSPAGFRDASMGKASAGPVKVEGG